MIGFEIGIHSGDHCFIKTILFARREAKCLNCSHNASFDTTKKLYIDFFSKKIKGVGNGFQWEEGNNSISEFLQLLYLILANTYGSYNHFMKIIFAFGFLLSFYHSFGQAGSLDTSFNYAIYNSFLNGDGPDGDLLCNALQTDGKILIGGYFSNISGHPIGRIARLNPDGSLDQTFNPGNIFNSAQNSNVSWIHVRADGKMFVGGYFLYWNGSETTSIVLLNQDGSIDPSFNTNTTSYASDCAVQADGKLIIGGNQSQLTIGVVTKNLPCRLNPNGTFDSSFDSGSGWNGIIMDMDYLPDGKITCVGTCTSYNGQSVSKIIRLNSDGSLDNTFVVTNVDNNARAVSHQSDGKIIVGGSFTTINGSATNTLVRFNIDGTLDNTFVTGTGFNGNIQRILTLNNDTLLVTGGFNSFNGNSSFSNLAKLLPNGTLDIQSVIGITMNSVAQAILVSPENKILLGGSFTTINNKRMPIHAILNFDFSVDYNYNLNTGSNLTLQKAIEDNQGKILIAGSLSSYNGVDAFGVCRLHLDGTRDSSFQTEYGLNNVLDICLQPDGKILAGGSFNGNWTTIPPKLVRLNHDGSTDISFVVGSSFDDAVNTIVYQPNGKILVGGDFLNYNGTPANRIVRLNQDGTIDNTFNIGVGFDESVRIIKLSNEGKIYIGGSFSSCNGQSANRLIRLFDDGSIDNSFQTGSGLNGGVYSIAETNSNDILIAGNFTSYNDTTSYKLIKLFSSGAIDINFNVITGSNGFINECIIQPDGKIIIGGPFYYNGSNSIKVLRLNFDGTLDNSYIMNFNPSTTINSLSLQANGKILATGNFLTVDGWLAKRICRFNNDVLGFSDLILGFENIQYPGCSMSGTVTATGFNGVPPFSFNWDGLADPTNPTQNITIPGNYNCTITDSVGFTLTQSVYMFGAISLNQPDLKVNLIAGAFRPGFNTTIQIDALNDGCQNASGTVKIILDTLLQVDSSMPTPSFQNGDTLIYDFSNLIFNSQHFTPELITLTSTNAQIGDTVTLKVQIEPFSNDFDTINNYREYKFPVVNGYDPNFKTVFPEGKCTDKFVDDQQILTYVVHFQNIGNSEAINICVVDTLDSELDSSTLRLTGSSHNVWLSLENNVVYFHFDNIMLSDSATNSLQSEGYAIFEVKPISGLSTSSTISNKAEIYFDYNPPIVTNYTINKLFIGNLDTLNCNPESNLGFQNLTTNSYISVYPNPFISEIFVSVHPDLLNKTLTLYSVTGNKEFEIVLEYNHTGIDISGLKPGVYFLRIDQYEMKLLNY